jgi:alpha-glucosidase
VLYQVYLRSFADSNADGVGDLPGLIEHLDHLAWLGIDAIWLSPVTASPNRDWGYDVADYYAIAPELGTMDDFDRLVADATARQMRIILDLVPNHTSDRHPWFVESSASRGSPRRNWYVWADGREDGTPPNNWVSSFGGPAWTLSAETGQYFLHNHLAEQPDLNWWEEGVHGSFDDILSFWADRGVAGFRIDVCNVIVKDRELRDNPPATEDDPLDVQLFGQRSIYNANRPEVHHVIKHWRQLAEARSDPFLLLGETPVPVPELVRYYGGGDDELHLAFNFDFINAPLTAEAMREVVEQVEAALPPGAWPAWTGSNHDMFRFATRWAENDPRRIRVALFMLLCLRGTPVLYQGDEIGMVDVTLEHEDLRDPLGVHYWPYYAGRDACRTPMQWHEGPGGGFTAPGTRPWLPLGDLSSATVAAQRDQPGSLLTLARDLIAFRRAQPSFVLGGYTSLEAPPGVWAWRRGPDHVVVLNLSDAAVPFTGVDGLVEVATHTQRVGEQLNGTLGLDPYEGVLVRSS